MNTNDLLINIRTVRLAKNLKQEYVAEQLNVSTATYSKLESGKVKLTANRLQQLAIVLNVSVNQLTDYNNNSEHIDQLIGNYRQEIDNLKQQTIVLLQEREQAREREQRLLEYIRVLEEKRN